MLCSMCQHGTTKFWKCTCGEHNCNHMLECTKCKTLKYTIEHQTMQEKIREIVSEVVKTTQCCCDLDNWEPEVLTGHSWVCDIHKKSMNKFNNIKS